jgi:hypothetical protein
VWQAAISERARCCPHQAGCHQRGECQALLSGHGGALSGSHDSQRVPRQHLLHDASEPASHCDWLMKLNYCACSRLWRKGPPACMPCVWPAPPLFSLHSFLCQPCSRGTEPT